MGGSNYRDAIATGDKGWSRGRSGEMTYICEILTCVMYELEMVSV